MRHRMKSLGSIRVAAAVVVAMSMTSSCLDPTEIVLELSTNVPCNVVEANGVAIAIGAPGDDDSGVATATSMCANGDIGTLVVVPSTGNGPEVGIRVMLGVDASTCEGPAYSGCIVERRALRYTPHMPLMLPISLDQSCVGVPCDPNSTCVNGGCVDAGTTCTGGVCEVADAAPPPPPPTGCVETKAPMLVTQAASVATPFIARTPTGYAVSWTDPAGNTASVATYAQDGTVLDARVPLDGFLPDAGGSPGPLASNGSSYAALYEYQPTNADLTPLVPVDGGPAPGNSVSPGAIATAGVFYDPSLATYVTVKVNLVSQVQFLTWPTAGFLGSSFGSGITSASLAWNGTSYFPVLHDATDACSVLACTAASLTNLTCSDAGITPPITLCLNIRAAVADAQHSLVAYVSATKTLIVDSTIGTAQYFSMETVDDTFAFVPLVTGSTPYRMIWRANDTLITANFSTLDNPPTVALTGTLGYTNAGGTGAGFDAVADDPATSTGYAFVYWSASNQTPGIYFEHRCQ